MAPPETSTALACPSLEEIAAFIDGRLRASDRAQLIEHLTDCEDCRTLVAETALLLQEVSPEAEAGAEAAVATFPTWRSRMVRTLLPLAAAAVLVLTIGPGVYRRFLQPASFSSISQNLRQMGASKLAPHVRQDVSRGPGDHDTDSELRERSFRAGAQTVYLQASLEAGDREAARISVLYLLRVLDSGVFKPSSTGFYEDLEEKLREPSSKALSQEAEDARQAARDLEPSFDEIYLLFGQWAEAGRLAAATKDPSFFERRGNRRFLDRVLEETDLDPESRAQLSQIRKTWDQGDLDAPDFNVLKKAFSRITDS